MAPLSAWLAPKHFLTLSVLIESMLSCLVATAFTLSQKCPFTLPASPLIHLLCLSVCALFTQLPVLVPSTTQRISPVSRWRPPEGHRLPLASAKWRGLPREVTLSDTTDVQPEESRPLGGTWTSNYTHAHKKNNNNGGIKKRKACYLGFFF